MSSRDNSEMDRWYALLVLLFLLVLMYFLFFQGFFSEHSMLNEEIADLEQSRQEYTELVEQIPELQRRIKQVKETVGDNTSFLVSDIENLGKSELTRLIKGIVAGNTESSAECQIISNTPSRDSKPDQFEKITLKVRMRCQFEKMIKVLKDIENNTPQLFVDNLQLEQRTQRARRSRRNITPTAPMLEVRFDLFAYMNNPVRAKKDDKK